MMTIGNGADLAVPRDVARHCCALVQHDILVSQFGPMGVKLGPLRATVFPNGAQEAFYLNFRVIDVGFMQNFG